jgi:RNase H-fold protein (predicted Holliday junction resolvase)
VTTLEPGEHLIGIDPGRDKCGLAVLDDTGAPIDKFVVATGSLVGALEHCLGEYPQSTVVIGDGTGSGDLQAAIAEALPDLGLHPVAEHHTTERALELWREVEPVRGWRRLLPRALRFPARPIDDLAAWILAADYLGKPIPEHWHGRRGTGPE